MNEQNLVFGKGKRKESYGNQEVWGVTDRTLLGLSYSQLITHGGFYLSV